MKAGFAAAIGWLLVAGVMQGVFPLPMKFTRRWKWEHLWFWYSAIAFFVLPIITALVTVPSLDRAYTQVPAGPLLWTALFGITWGIGSVLYGLGIDALGMALGFPVMTALTTALGALVPMIALTPQMIFQPSGIFTMAGNLVTFAGVAVCAVAGERRDRKLGRTPAILGPRRTFSAALTICIAAGALSAMFNLGYAFGEPIVRSATAFGATRDDAVNAVWAVMLPAGGIINLGYCMHLVRTHKSGPDLARGAARDWFCAVSMAVLWTFSVVIYGWGANRLGPLGPTLGWSLWNAILIATTVICGLMTGEWAGVRGSPIRWLGIGIGLLITGSFVLGAGAS
jgi:L-rhamnose-H+ transport protein